MFFLFLLYCPVQAQDEEYSPKHQFSVGAGLEVLNYQEHEPGSSVDSESEPFNTVLKAQYLGRLSSKLLYGITCILPVVENVDGEEWRSGGFLFQSNSLSYQWTRIDTYVVSGGDEGIGTLLGLRMGNGKQTRRNFVAPYSSGTISEAVEEISSLGVMLGAQFSEKKKNSAVKLHILYALPLLVKVTNTALPGVSFSDKKGYTLETGAEILYAEKFSLGVLWGVMHWNGSDWKPVSPFGYAKWPENDTRYGSAIMSVYF